MNTTIPRKIRLRQRLAAFEADPRWSAVKAPEAVTATLLDAPELPYPVVRCVTELACPAAVLMRFLVDDVTETLPSWSRDIEACEELQVLSDDERLVLVRTGSPVPLLAAREDLFYVHRGVDEDGAFFEVAEVTDELDHPIAPGAVRSHMYFASKHITPLPGGGCRYDVQWQYDPMGWLSKLLPLAIGVAAVHDHMKDECLKLRAHFGAR